jgi:DNA polymerase III delta subunit
MATYAQWYEGTKKNAPKRVTWVCGDQPVLVEEVVDTVRTLLAVPASHRETYSASVTTEVTIWAAAQQLPLNPDANRLITIRDADRMRYWSPLKGFLADWRLIPRNHLLFVSSKPEFPDNTDLEPIKAKGQVVRCAQPNPADLIAWTRRRGPTLDHRTAVYLIDRAGGKLSTIANVCAQLAAFPDMKPSQVTITTLADGGTATEFLDHLLAFRKADAAHAIPLLSDREVLLTIAAVDQRLEYLQTLWYAERDKTPAAGVPPFLARMLTPLAHKYEPATCARQRSVLAVLDHRVRTGTAGPGVLEALVALW